MTSPFGIQGSAAAMEQKARELGRLIGQSSEYQTMMRANDSLNTDQESAATLSRMETLRTEARRLISRGEEPPVEMERELDELLTKVQGRPAYQRMIVAHENFEKTMQLVNEWITEGIKSGATSSIITLG